MTFTVEKWKRDRRIIAPAFNTKVIQQFIPIFYKNNTIFLQNFKKKVGSTEPFDLWGYIFPHSLNVICRMFIKCLL